MNLQDQHVEQETSLQHVEQETSLQLAVVLVVLEISSNQKF